MEEYLGFLSVKSGECTISYDDGEKETGAYGEGLFQVHVNGILIRRPVDVLHPSPKQPARDPQPEVAPAPREAAVGVGALAQDPTATSPVQEAVVPANVHHADNGGAESSTAAELEQEAAKVCLLGSKAVELFGCPRTALLDNAVCATGRCGLDICSVVIIGLAGSCSCFPCALGQAIAQKGLRASGSGKSETTEKASSPQNKLDKKSEQSSPQEAEPVLAPLPLQPSATPSQGLKRLKKRPASTLDDASAVAQPEVAVGDLAGVAEVSQQVPAPSGPQMELEGPGCEGAAPPETDGTPQLRNSAASQPSPGKVSLAASVFTPPDGGTSAVSHTGNSATCLPSSAPAPSPKRKGRPDAASTEGRPAKIRRGMPLLI
jgi:hypothetical protein